MRRRADRAARVDNVVDKEDGLAGNVLRHPGAVDHRLLEERREVVAVERNVELSAGHLYMLVILDHLLDAAGEVNSPPVDADQDHVVRTLVVFHYFAGDPADNSVKVLRIHEARLFS